MKKTALLVGILISNLVVGQVPKKPASGKTFNISSIRAKDNTGFFSASKVPTSVGNTKDKPTRLCYTSENEAIRRAKNPNLPSSAEFEQWIQKKIQEQPKNAGNEKGNSRIMADPLYTIPVIVHIIHNGEAVGQGANISAAQAYSQIQVLNEDFRRTNADAINTRAAFASRAADFEIEFLLATHDEDGNRLAEPGIVRHNLGRASWDTNNDIETIAKPNTIWNTSKYCNMWTINFGGDMAGILGYAEFPTGSSLPGMPGGAASTDTDGLVMGYQYFGSSDKDTYGTFTLNAPYDLGRTATHEIGHWLGLRHIWGDGGCTVDDYVSDTPTAANSNGGCPAATTNSCGNGPTDEPDMTENYMDYTNDACMNMFTAGQKARAVAVMNSSPGRSELPSSNAHTPSYYDAGVVAINYEKDCSGNLSGFVYLTNYATSQSLSSVEVVFEVDGTIITTQNWSGTLAPMETGQASFSAISLGTGEHILKVYTQNPNNNADENTGNDAYVETISTNPISGGYAQNFESGSYDDFIITSGSQSAVGLSTYAANGGTYGLYFEGSSSTDYPAAPNGPTEAEAFTDSHSHYAAAQLCYDATEASALTLTFDYKLNFALSNAYTSFRYKVISDAAGTYTSPVYQPSGADKDWSTVSLNLDSHVGGDIKIIFEANCKYAQANINGTADDGNAVFIDNIQLDYTSNRPEIFFASVATTINESSALTIDGCRNYTDYTVNLNIANPTVSGAQVNILEDGTATTIADYELLTSSVSFATGSSASQPVTIRIYDDYDVESNETIILNLAFNGNSDASIASYNNSFTLTIGDNDAAPVPVFNTVTLLDENFETGMVGYTILQGPTHSATSPNTWRTGNYLSIDGNSAYVSRSATASNYSATKTTDIILRSPILDATGLTNIEISFDIAVDGELNFDYGTLYYSLEASPNSFVELAGPYEKTGGVITVAGTLTGFDGEKFYLAWGWNNDNSNAGEYAIAVDNISLTGKEEVETIATSQGSNNSIYFGPYQTVHIYDETDGKLIVSLTNESMWDYGCTSVTIDRSGTAVKEFWNAGVEQSLTDKTVTITPTNNTLVGGYTISLYYTEEEIVGWETATGNTRDNLQLAKVSGATVSQVSPTSFPAEATGNVANAVMAKFGGQCMLTASFNTGFSSFGAGIPGEPPAAPLPVNLRSFTGWAQQEDIKLNWQSATEENVSHYELEYSTNGADFSYLNSVQAIGNSEHAKSYSFVHANRTFGMHYYRLRMVDNDGSFEYSPRVSVQQTLTNFAIESIFPNPAEAGIRTRLKLQADQTENLVVSIRTIQGVEVMQHTAKVSKGSNEIVLPTQHFKAGLYLVDFVNSSQQRVQQKLLIK